jgi:hypothetical protein
MILATQKADTESHVLRPGEAENSQDTFSINSWAWWHTPVIPTIWDIRRTTGPGQPRQKVHKTPSQWIKLGEVTCTCHFNYVGNINRRITFQSSTGKKSKTKSQKQPEQKRLEAWLKQAQSPEFKNSVMPYQKKIQKRKRKQ